jgi:mono/diheme cytochrome c family protein
VEKQLVSMPRKPGKRTGVRLVAGAAIFALAGAVSSISYLPVPAAAQDATAFQPHPGLKVWQTHGCANCHSGFATGGHGGDFPNGPNLRTTKLTLDEVRETIACGRGQMPTHLEGAYTTVPCYGMDLGEVPEGQAVGVQMSSAELDDLMDFLSKYVVGVPMTKEVCGVYNRGNKDAPICKQFPD